MARPRSDATIQTQDGKGAEPLNMSQELMPTATMANIVGLNSLRDS